MIDSFYICTMDTGMSPFYETWKITINEHEGDSCSFCPSILDNQNALIQYKIPNKKPRKKKEESDDKTISKMLRKKLTRFLDKKHKSNIKRKISEYHF